MSWLDTIKDVGGDAFNTAKSAYIEYSVAMKEAGDRGAIARQQSLADSDRTVPENATPIPADQVANDARQAAASYQGGVMGFWNGLEGWQKAVLGGGTLALAFMAVRR